MRGGLSIFGLQASDLREVSMPPGRTTAGVTEMIPFVLTGKMWQILRFLKAMLAQAVEASS